MANSSSVMEKSFHVRSISLPSRAHPTALKVEEELHNLENICADLSASAKSCMTMEMIVKGLRHLADLYDGIEELLCLPSIQQDLFKSDQMKSLEKYVDGSLRLLDLCSTMKDVVTTSKEHILDLQFIARRRNDNSTRTKVKAFILSRKETQKIVKKSYRDLTGTDDKYESASPSTQDSDVPVVLKLFKEVRIITRSLLCSIMSTMSVPEAKASRWSFISKSMRVASKDSLCELCATIEDADVEKLLMVQNQLKTIESNFGDLENGLECLFRRLIRNRVSLLNTLSL